MKNGISFFFCVILVSAVWAMQPSQEKQVLHPVPKTSILFLHAYVEKRICDVDERGVYFNENTSGIEPTPIHLPWDEVAKILKEADKDSNQQAGKDQAHQSNEYQDVLQRIKEFRSLPPYQSAPAHAKILCLNPLQVNRSIYTGAWESGDPALVKAALKLELFDAASIKN